MDALRAAIGPMSPDKRIATEGQMNPADLVKTAMEPAAHGGFSFLELFLQAHIVVKVVMLGLLLSSVWSWAIIVEKLISFRKAKLESERFEQQFWSGQSLEEIGRAHV